MNSKYTSKNKIFEDFFDDEEISGTVSDVSEPGSDELSLDSDSDKLYIPRHQLCLFLQNPMILYQLSQSTIRKLRSLMDSMRYIYNIRIVVTGYVLDKPWSNPLSSSNVVERDFFECSMDCPPIAVGSPRADIVQLQFDYNERHSNSPFYMTCVMCDVMMFFIKFGIILKMPIEYQERNMRITYMPEDLTNYSERAEAKHFMINVFGYYRALKVLNLAYTSIEKVVKLMNEIGSSVTIEDFIKYQNSVNPRSSYLMDALTNQNVSRNLLNKIEIDEYTMKKEKELIVKIPEGKELRLKNLSLSILKEDMKKEKLSLVVDGTLIINSFDEISNLKFLKTDYKHNKLIVQTLISPKILKYLLVSVYFNELDLSHADFTEEISVDLSYKHVMNHNIKITSNSQLEIKNSTE